MIRTLRISWAGPAVALALGLSALSPVRGSAATVTRAPVTTLAAHRATVACVREAYDYVVAIKNWLAAWEDYQNTLPGGTEQEILDSAARLDQASSAVGTAGFKLLACLLGTGPRAAP